MRIRQAAVPGHFYSVVPSLKEVRSRDAEIFPVAVPDELPGIALQPESEIALVEQLAKYYAEQPFSADPQPNLRYYFENKLFRYGDALMLYSMLRHIAPKRIVEVGSGFSSAVTLDTNERFFSNSIDCTFIEPYPDRLRNLLQAGDTGKCELLECPVQKVDSAVFDQLQAGDILFIDSSHTAKVGSDVTHIFSEILPSLAVGVVVHVHDISYPFEYPKTWIYQGRFHNEAYILRAFLQFNRAFEIMVFNSYLGMKHFDEVVKLMPLWGRDPGGSIWMQRIAQ